MWFLLVDGEIKCSSRVDVCLHDSLLIGLTLTGEVLEGLFESWDVVSEGAGGEV